MYQIDSLSRIPVYEQIVEQTKRFILSGVLCPGAQMASVRGIAFEHTINPRTVLRAYNELNTAGLIKAVPGKGYFVCENARALLQQENHEKMQELFGLFGQMRLAGVAEQELIDCVKAAYGKPSKFTLKKEEQ